MNIFSFYLKIGFEHVCPLGWDHNLFIVSLFFFDSKLKTAIIQCTVFTLAHSFTLFLSALGYYKFQFVFLESLIALSIFFAALENTKKNPLGSRRLIVIFLFGLVHGFGFASALKDNGLTAYDSFLSLLGFNLGVELAQVMIIVMCYSLIAMPFRNRSWYHSRLVNPISMFIASIALFLTIERFIAV